MAGTEESGNRLEDMTVPLAPLVKILECAVCLEVVKIPFKSCQRGHLVCNECIKTLLNCPTCKAEFATENHVSVKNIVEMLLSVCRVEVLPRACRHAENGCTEVVAGAHDEKFCGFRRISCQEFRVMTNQHLLAHDFKKRALDFANENSITYINADKKVLISGCSWFHLYDSYKYNFVPHFEYDALFLLKFTKQETLDFVNISCTSYFIGKPVDDVFIRITLRRPNVENVELRVTLKACPYGETDEDIIKLSQATVLSYMLFSKCSGNCRDLTYNYEIFQKPSN